MAQIASRMTQLHGKGRVAQQFHELAGILHAVRNRNRHWACEHAGHFAVAKHAAEALGNHRGQSVVHRLGHGSGEFGPLVDGAFHPSGAGEHIGLSGSGIELACRVQPQIRLAHSTSSGFTVHCGHAGLRAGSVGLLQCD